MAELTHLLAGSPEVRNVTAEHVREARVGVEKVLVVLDDDPTGTQSVRDLPVLSAWAVDDLEWALGTGADAVYVMTNSRSLSPADAATRNREVVSAALEASARTGVEAEFVSRSDSTLRGHFPLEPDTIIEQLMAAGRSVDGVVIVPAFGDAGRITINSIHYAGSEPTGYVPVGETEFAKDATFGYASSDLRDWVAEKTEGRIARDDVRSIALAELRSNPRATVSTLNSLSDGAPVVVDTVEESDLRSLALALLEAEQAGKRFVYRVGPPFVRALIGQDIATPLTSEEVSKIRKGEQLPGGLIVVGSHVDQTTRQLNELNRRSSSAEFEIEVSRVLESDHDEYLEHLADEVHAALTKGNVVLRTSRKLVTGKDADDSLQIARAVSDAVVRVVRRILSLGSPRFVIAKGGITSSDVASRGLEIGRAIVRGPMLPGIVSLWEPIDGPAQGIPYIVFAGNVGDDQSLADVAEKLSA